VSAFDRLDVYHDRKERSAALNMAMDEALLESAAMPAIRFYGWARSALSFGYFGRFDEAQKVGAGRELVRRWTGGGIVLHGTDLTYSIVVPATQDCFANSPGDFYFKVHAAIREALLQKGIAAVLADFASPKISDACFANPVHADVLSNGEKIAGAAQRRTRHGLLQQGSVQYEKLPHDFAERFARILCPAAEPRILNDQLTQRAHEIAQHKYAQQHWLRRR
jgi:lipoyl(octanoyl) transferase